MSHVQFSDYIMFCNSTENQTVNLLPILQLQCRQSVIISTDFTEKKGVTDRLMKILQKKDVKVEKMVIDKQDEKNLNDLTNKLIQNAKGRPKVIWNISGGQKIPASAMLNAFQRRIAAGFENDIVTYTEAKPPEIWYFGADYKSHSIETSVFLSLSDLLYLSGYETLKDETKLYPELSGDKSKQIEIGKKALQYFNSDALFREGFFNYMKPPLTSLHSLTDIKELIRKMLNDVKPSINELAVSRTGYENLEQKISQIFSKLEQVNNKEELRNLIKPLKLIQKPAEIYDDYWNVIKKAVVDKALKSLESNEIKLIKSCSPTEEQNKKLREQILSLGGQVTKESGPLYKCHVQEFSSIKGNGFLFEWMVAAAILEEIEKNPKLKDSISEIYHGVKTKKIDTEERHDAEHDIIIVTRFGTLIIVELKTYAFTGDLVQAQEGLAYKKSGPYGKAVIIGPLISEMVKIKEDGSKEFPSYIDGPITSQENTARQNNTEYYYLDKIVDMLKKNLHVRS